VDREVGDLPYPREQRRQVSCSCSCSDPAHRRRLGRSETCPTPPQNKTRQGNKPRADSRTCKIVAADGSRRTFPRLSEC